MKDYTNIDPYTPPKAKKIINTDLAEPSQYKTKGRFLLIKNGAKLPNICLLSGEPAQDESREKRTLHWLNPTWNSLQAFALAILAINLSSGTTHFFTTINIILMIYCVIHTAIYYYLRKQIVCDFYISSAAKKKRRHRAIICFSLIILLGIIFSLWLVDYIQNNRKIGGLISIFTVIVLFIHFRFNTKIKIIHNMKGWYYITGTNKAFITAINHQNIALKSEPQHPVQTS